MKHHRYPALSLRLTLLAGWLMLPLAARASDDIRLDKGWSLRSIEFTQKTAAATPVSLPHTWNAAYADGKRHYNRETMIYERSLDIAEATKRYFLYFEGVNSVAEVFVNRKTAGRHLGGYTAFCLEITDLVHTGSNELEVWVSNAYRTDVLPISGDFNVYGGIHRPVHLLVKEPDCLDPDGTGCATSLVLQPREVSDSEATLDLTAYLSLRSDSPSLRLTHTLCDADGRTVAQVTVPAANGPVSARLKVAKPILWNGRINPYLYTLHTRLTEGETTLDEQVLQTGFRYFSVDAAKGFSLNGRPYDLHGVNRHDDFKGFGSAMGDAQYRRDIGLLDTLGATALRLAHYPHAEPIYDLSDRLGLVVWTEIPLCGPGGYRFTGYVLNAEANARQSLREMIYQKGHHPSVCFWGLFNELLIDEAPHFKAYDHPVAFVQELDSLCHALDPSRLTCFATCVDQVPFLQAADLVAWNKYFAWDKATGQCAEFLDRVCAEAGQKPVGLSEYGRGGSPWQHADPRYADTYDFPGTYHPEEYQTLCHENYWQAISERPWIWWKTVWQFSDMQSCIKDEGDTPGINDKGLVTYDRHIAKDAYRFYQAQWNPAPMLHLCSSRFTERKEAVTDVRAYTTLPSATLYLNGKKISTRKPDALHRLVWEGIELQAGDNLIEIRAGKTLIEKAVWHLTPSAL